MGPPFGHLQPLEPELHIIDDHAMGSVAPLPVVARLLPAARPPGGGAPPAGRATVPWGRRRPSLRAATVHLLPVELLLRRDQSRQSGEQEVSGDARPPATAVHEGKRRPTTGMSGAGQRRPTSIIGGEQQ
jgi:hypothetical protein